MERLDGHESDRVGIAQAPGGHSSPLRCGSHAGPRWHVVQTHRGAESLVVDELANQGFSTLCPLRRIDPDDQKPGQPRRHRKRQRFARFGAAFPGYLFVLFDQHSQPWRCIHSTRGVKRLFSWDEERPIPVPVGVVERLMVAMSRNIMPVIDPEAHEDLADGAIVDIIGTALAGQAAVVLRGKVHAGAVSVQILATGWVAEVPRECVAVAA
jgi:transcription antitermination factor NusG